MMYGNEISTFIYYLYDISVSTMCIYRDYCPLNSYLYIHWILDFKYYYYVRHVSSMGRALAFRADGPGSIPGPA